MAPHQAPASPLSGRQFNPRGAALSVSVVDSPTGNASASSNATRSCRSGAGAHPFGLASPQRGGAGSGLASPLCERPPRTPGGSIAPLVLGRAGSAEEAREERDSEGCVRRNLSSALSGMGAAWAADNDRVEGVQGHSQGPPTPSPRGSSSRARSRSSRPHALALGSSIDSASAALISRALTCARCGRQHDPGHLMEHERCGHSTCVPCIRRLVAAAASEATCNEDSVLCSACAEPLPAGAFLPLLPEQEREAFLSASLDALVRHSDALAPCPNCGTLIERIEEGQGGTGGRPTVGEEGKGEEPAAQAAASRAPDAPGPESEAGGGGRLWWRAWQSLVGAVSAPAPSEAGADQQRRRREQQQQQRRRRRRRAPPRSALLRLLGAMPQVGPAPASDEEGSDGEGSDGEGGASVMADLASAALMVERGPDGRPLSEEARAHRDQHRMRCSHCGHNFCLHCRAAPYHLGRTCRQHHAQRKCRFCDAQLPDAAASTAAAAVGDEAAPWQGEEGSDVCADAECRDKLARACVARLPCGHRCPGARGEDEHMPCLHPGCAGSGAADGPSREDVPLEVDEGEGDEEGEAVAPGDTLPTRVARNPASTAAARSASGDDFCGICWAESLRQDACLMLDCGHVFHAACVEQQLRGQWPGPRITFRFCRCPTCHARIRHPALRARTDRYERLEQRVRSQALKRLEAEGRTADPEVAEPGARFYGQPQDYAMQRYAYYLCSKCGRPYFGGLRECEAAGPAGPAGDDDEGGRDFDPSHLGACSLGPRGRASHH